MNKFFKGSDTHNTLTCEQLRHSRRTRRLYFSTALAVALCAALTVPAFAAGSEVIF